MARFEEFDIVVLPFPFTEQPRTKRRPALVLSAAKPFADKIGHSVMAMITSSKNPPWPLDTEIEDHLAAGLPVPSKVRMKLFTLDHRLIVRQAGKLGPRDRQRVTQALRTLLGGI